MEKESRKALFSYLFSGVDLSSRTPHGLDGAGLPPVDTPLQPLGRGERMGLGQGIVRQYDGMEGIARGEARLLTEVGRSGGGA